ncbi:MAG: DUF4374 domain-containing protein [Tannerella sp.]|jgi:hypothetical protein|nr:DUF4374 domain-containing protein [Tannerella sp.]
MNTKAFFYHATVALGAIIVLASCDKTNNDDSKQSKGAYLIAASSADGSYLLQSEDIASGQVTIVGNGIESDASTAWIFYRDKYAYSLMYRQGDPATVSAYELDAEGNLTPRMSQYQMPSRYTTYGSFGDYIVTAVSVTRQDETPGLAFNFLDVKNQTITEKVIAAGNFTGNGETANLSGILEVGDRFFSGVCTTPAVNAGGTAGTVTEYPDSVWVAVFDSDLNHTVIRDGRLSYATGRYRSGYHTNLAKDADDNVYVFSSAYDSRTTRPSGVIRIMKGEDRFDPDYFFDIQSAANGRHLYKVWYITADYFLLQMYNTPNQTSEALWSILAVVDVTKKTYREVTGLPALDKITSIGATPYAEDGKITIPIVSTDEYPHIYVIDPATASAARGLEIIAEGATAVGKLTY